MSARPTAARLARAVLHALWLGGVREFALSPGSRSAPLAIALYAAERAGDVRLHVRVDERSAGFLALGLAIGSGVPVAVVTTSGTAVANLLPAVMEAQHSGRRVIVLSADRPERLRGTGANQTTRQAGIFGSFAPCHDLAQDASGSDVAQAVAAAVRAPGPTQLNLQFDGDLLPPNAEPDTWWTRPSSPSSVQSSRSSVQLSRSSVQLSRSSVQLSRSSVQLSQAEHDSPRQTSYPMAGAEPLTAGPRTVVVAGDDAGPSARLLAEAGNWPLLAAPTSGARPRRPALSRRCRRRPRRSSPDRCCRRS
ncbi:MAG: hypothetical protein L0H79_02765 [Intrasporangium sp.]|uniref:thiamine pyrophosphate-binding protein n=1 Tax=Intrasporangium sp. TaxID=1925024 RepID=UPI002648BD8B|nr:thiamine pyrophosphate-binding protein [Intrasporangium sp.]MDN5794657.1 hypothetical protein [Intrasporangium sp.]